ncbi:hypothetical protein A1O3_01982 [Capronia epimyces CBS 606.96]|uniref:Murein transglycosylase n=1 Tax=Capronia epimyces CBS 606.96 TaxID=1182542 RepID=W9Y8T3_9EURO|nr:uncharacterized protein A1O3_01982 [Capronia epimyces CBS 606.96]EXJ88918.1 hypothetical protein A1O3_01982 [Capronia epimyces CBS 606.96]
MKAIVFGLAALGAQLGKAVPHGNNQHHRLHLRHELTDYATVTDIVTITAPNAVVWVDQYNNIISTEYRGVATPTTTASNSVVPVASILTSTTPNVPASSTLSPSETYAPTSAPSILSSSNYVSSNWASSSLISSTSPAASNPISDSTTAIPSSDTSGGGTGGDKISQHIDTASAQFSGFGICYELIGDSGCKDQGSLDSDFAALASQGYTKVRTYDIGCNLGTAAAAAAAQGLQLIIGLNSIGNVANDITTLVSMISGNWSPIDTVVIGNEVVNNGGDAGSVVAAIAVARPILSAAGFSKNVVTVDTFNAHELHPELCQASDYCAANAHAFFDPNTSADGAGKFVTNAAAAVAKIANGKPVIITESGWPWQGSPNGLAVPSPANQQTAINSLNTAFNGNPGGLFLFQAYDATYKAPGPLGVEQFFGIYGH